MNLARPLFLVLLLSAICGTAMAADDPTPAWVASAQVTGTISLEQSAGNASGLNLSVANNGHIATSNDGLCYTMRMYKIKRTERLSDGESGRRGYTTCQMASNYEFRSAVARPRRDRDFANNDAGR